MAETPKTTQTRTSDLVLLDRNGRIIGAPVTLFGGGGGSVTSVFGRTLAVVAETSDYDAVQIDVTPTGSIAATNVQSALAELDTEKATVSHTHALADITDEGALASKSTVATGDIDNDAVTYAKIQNVTDARVLGRAAGTVGDVQELTAGAGISFAAGEVASTITQYTDEAAQDAVGAALLDTTTVNLTYNDPTNQISADVIPTGIKLDALGAPDDNTDLNASISAHGLLQKLPGGTTTFLRADGAFAAPTGGAGANVGTATLDFGAFPGTSDTSVAVTGQTGIVAGSIVQAWIRPAATADHTADEHMAETLKVFAGNIVAGTGFTIYGFNTSQLNEPVELPRRPSTAVLPTAGMPAAGRAKAGPEGAGGGRGTRIYGQWTVAWSWN